MIFSAVEALFGGGGSGGGGGGVVPYIISGTFNTA